MNYSINISYVVCFLWIFSCKDNYLRKRFMAFQSNNFWSLQLLVVSIDFCVVRMWKLQPNPRQKLRCFPISNDKSYQRGLWESGDWPLMISITVKKICSFWALGQHQFCEASEAAGGSVNLIVPATGIMEGGLPGDLEQTSWIMSFQPKVTATFESRCGESCFTINFISSEGADLLAVSQIFQQVGKKWWVKLHFFPARVLAKDTNLPSCLQRARESTVDQNVGKIGRTS